MKKIKNRDILKVGSTISLKERSEGYQDIFKITKVLGQGGSYIVYEVIKEDGVVNKKSILKEFYPLELADSIYREDKNLVYSKEVSETFQKEAADFNNSYFLLRELKTNIELNNYIITPLSYYESLNLSDVSGTYYILSDYDTGEALSLAEVSSLKEVFTIALNIAKSLHEIHKLGKLYLNLKPANVFVSPVNKGRRVKLFDVDAMLSKEELGNESTVRFSYSDGWLAPEVEKWLKGRGVLDCRHGEAIDYYGLGLIIRHLLGSAIYAERIRGSMEHYYQLEASHKLYQDINPESFELIEELLNQLLRFYPKERLADGGTIIARLEDITAIINSTVKNSY